MTLAALTLLHVLVFVYWLGGDLGAFYASRIISDPGQSPAARLTAARVLNNLDMAPRTALILTTPTGLTLAAAKGWLAPPTALQVAVWIGALAWLALAWRIHLGHLAPADPLRRLDLVVRWIVLAALAAAAGAIAAGLIAGPAFLAAKLAILAAAIVLGLVIRVLVAPIGPAFATLAAGASTPQADAALSTALARARPAVLGLWGLLLLAAFLGLWTPA